MNLPINFQDKQNSPELLAFLQQYGQDKYLTAQEINQIRDGINELYNTNGQGSGVVDNTGFAFVGTDLIFNELFSWKFFGELTVLYDATVMPIPYTSTGKHRTDIVVARAGVLIRIAGPENDVALPAPEPSYNFETDLRITAFEVNESDFGTIEPPIVESSFIPKESISIYEYNGAGANVSIPFKPNGAGTYVLTNAGLTSVKGFNASNPPIMGQTITIENATGGDVLIKYDDPSAAVAILPILGEDLILPNGIMLVLKYKHEGLRQVVALGGGGSQDTTNTSELINDGENGTDKYIAESDLRLTDSRIPTAHTHIISDVTNLQSSLDSKEPSFSKNTGFNKPFGSAVNTVVQGNDARLSNARTPTAHTHPTSQITGLDTALSGKEPTFTKNTGFNKNFGDAVNTVAQGNDSRFHTHSNKAFLDTIDQPLAQANTPYFTSLNIGGGINCNTFSYGKAISFFDDVDTIIVAGFYDGNDLANAPIAGYLYYTVQTHANSNVWCHQMATSFGAGNEANRVFTRTRVNGIWSAWDEIIKKSDAYKQFDVSSSRTLTEADNGAILKIKSNSTLTIPASGLPVNFNLVARTFSGATLTIAKVAGVTTDAPTGLVLPPNKMLTLFRDGASQTYIIQGETTV